MSHEAPEHDDDLESGASEETSDSSDTVSVFALLPAIATLALVTTVVSRALSPALLGIGVGLGPLAPFIEFLGSWLSQGFVCAAAAVVLGLIVVTVRSQLSTSFRVLAVVLCGLSVFPTFVAVRTTLPDGMRAVLALSASGVALLSALSARRAPFARVPAMVLGLVGLGELLRVVAVLASHAPFSSSLVLAVRGGLSASFYVELLAIALAVGWVGAKAQKLASPRTVVALGASALLTQQALAGRGDEAHPVAVVVAQAAERLMSRPDPVAPVALRIFIAFLAPLLALVLLVTPRSIPALGIAMALALLAHGSAEMPPAALMLIIGSLGLALAAQDGKSTWMAIGK